MTEETKKNIDNMTYISMLSLWRNAQIGHPYLTGIVGDYFSEVMKNKRAEITAEEHTQASKHIGWSK